MFGFEHHTHAALAELVQDAVFAKYQRFGLSLIDRLGLILCQLVGADEFPGESFGVLGAPRGREAVLKGIDLSGREQATGGQVLDELLQTDGHGVTSTPRPRIWSVACPQS